MLRKFCNPIIIKPRLFTFCTINRLYTNKSTDNNEANNQKDSKQEAPIPTESEQEPLTTLKEELGKKEKALAEMKDLYLRAVAEQQNISKRNKKMQEDIKLYSLQKFILDLLSTTDVLGIAINSVKKESLENNKELNTFFEGIKMTQTAMFKTLEKYGVKEINPVNEKFNPNLHEAVYQVVVKDTEPGNVTKVEKVGYTLNERVIRPAQVGVAKPE